MSVVTAPIFTSDPNADLIRRIIEARAAYERLCGVAPTCIHVNGSIREALAARGLQEIAGMKAIASPESIADMAICSRDEGLFKAAAPAATINLKPARARSKLR